MRYSQCPDGATSRGVQGLSDHVEPDDLLQEKRLARQLAQCTEGVFVNDGEISHLIPPIGRQFCSKPKM